MKIEHAAPPPPPPTFKGPPPVVIDMPAVNIISEAPVQATITETAKATPAPAPVVQKDVIIPPKQDKRYPISASDEIYPSMSKRLGEEGTVTLLLTLNEQGRVTEVSVKESSGFERLDNAAATDAKKWRFQPGTVNGKAASMQYPFRLVFKMQK